MGNQLVNTFLNQKSNVYNIDLFPSKKKNKSKFIKTDITDENSLKKVLKYFLKKKIKLDILINNASNNYNPKNKKLSKLTLEDFSNDLWENDLTVGLKGSYYVQKYLVHICQKIKRGYFKHFI